MGITCLSPNFLIYEMALVCTCRAGARIQGDKAGSIHMQVAGGWPRFFILESTYGSLVPPTAVS